jgi:hypothetical protein
LKDKKKAGIIGSSANNLDAKEIQN